MQHLHTNSERQKPPALWACSQGLSLERDGCSDFPGCQPQVVGHSSLCARHGSRNGHGTAQETMVCMETVLSCFSSSTTVGRESQPRCISQPTAYRREAKEAVLVQLRRSVTLTHPSLQRTINSSPSHEHVSADAFVPVSWLYETPSRTIKLLSPA